MVCVHTEKYSSVIRPVQGIISSFFHSPAGSSQESHLLAAFLADPSRRPHNGESKKINT